MLRRSILMLGLAWSALLSQAALAAEPLPPASQWIPQDAIVALELVQPKALLDLAFDPKLAEAVTSTPAYQKQASQPEFRQFLAIVSYVETMIGIDWQTGLRNAIGSGVTVAANARGEVFLAVDAKDEQTLAQLHEMFLGFARGEAEKNGQSDRIASKEYRGVTSWTFGGDEVHAIIGNRFLLSNKPEGLKAMLDLRAEPDGGNLASLPAYRAAKEAAGADATATLFVNVAALKAHPPVQEALAKGPEPAASLLIPGLTEALRESTWAAAGLHIKGKTLKLRAVADGEAGGVSGPAPFAYSSKPDDGAWPNLSVPRQIAGLSFYRDLHGFYAAKDELFPERTSGLIFFENMMGIFFSGRDLTEEVLAETMPEVRAVVAQQEYDPAIGTPQLQIPAFAAVFRLRNPEKFGEVVEEAWQKAVGLVNFTRGQQADPGLIIDRPTHGGTKFTAAHFASSGKEDGAAVDSQYNYRPSVAMPGNYLILSSTEALARDLIDALNKETAEPVKALSQTHSLVAVDVVQVASILGANRENMVRQNMLENGSTQQQAETQIDLIVTVLKYLGRAQLSLGRHDGRAEASVQLELNLP